VCPQEAKKSVPTSDLSPKIVMLRSPRSGGRWSRQTFDLSPTREPQPEAMTYTICSFCSFVAREIGNPISRILAKPNAKCPPAGRCDRSLVRSTWDGATSIKAVPYPVGYGVTGISQVQEMVHDDEKYPWG
jgi:hypothetical protein